MHVTYVTHKNEMVKVKTKDERQNAIKGEKQMRKKWGTFKGVNGRVIIELINGI